MEADADLRLGIESVEVGLNILALNLRDRLRAEVDIRARVGADARLYRDTRYEDLEIAQLLVHHR